MIAFYAQLTENLTHLGKHQIIIFDAVVTNIGNPYNKNIGVFTTPVSGIYVFTWTSTNIYHSFMNTEIMKNGVVFGHAMSDAMDHDNYDVASSTVVLQLLVGDTVWIRTGTWHNGHIAGSYLSTFSGWLIG